MLNRLSAIYIIIVFLSGPQLYAQVAVDGNDPLTIKQQLVKDRMAQLEDRMFRLAEKLNETQPEQAQQLQQALHRAKELLIRRNMDETAGLLERRMLTEAADRQLAITKNLERILEILLAEPDLNKQRQEEIKRLEKFLKQVNELAKKQRSLKADVDAIKAGKAGKNAGEQKKMADSAKQQSGLEKQASQLAKQMSGEPKEGDKQQAKQPPAPGAQNVKKSAKHMNEATDDLEKKQPREAGKDQEKALDELEQAKQELAESIEQLQREQQAETLRKLESQFRLMLTRQLVVNTETDGLDKKGQPNWSREEQLKLAHLVKEEKETAGMADEVLKLLEDEGTTIVFPQIIGQLRDDMLAVAQYLTGKDTGKVTRNLEAAIVTTLKELIEAMKKERDDAQSGGSSSKGGGPGKKPPLVPIAAEFKLLLLSQRRVHRQTADFDKLRGGSEQLDDTQRRELNRLTDRQKDLGKIAKDIEDRLTK